MTFPGYGAQIYYNEAGEVLGWDYPDRDDPYEPDDWERDEERSAREASKDWPDDPDKPDPSEYEDRPEPEEEDE